MWRFFLIPYSLLYLAAGALWVLASRLGLARRGKQTVVLPRLGLSSTLAKIKVQEGTRIWIHAVSVGEVNAVRPLVEALAGQEEIRLYVSTVTATGRQVARERFRPPIQVIDFPADLGFACRRFIRYLKPNLILLAETELWPNFLIEAEAAAVPVLLVNGRISDRSFRRYRRLAWLFGPLIQRLTHACVQSRQDKERLLTLGLPPERVNWVGNLKFDCTIEPDPAIEPLLGLVRRKLKSGAQPSLWICGSTKPGEEEQLVRVYLNLRVEFPELTMVLAPRHPHRAVEVLELVSRQGLPAELRSRLAHPGVADRLAVVVLDTVGELSRLYEVADLVFVGGSLVPEGGQNLIEPAYFGKPILVGPDMSNFREVTDAFREAYAVLQVKDAAELETRLGDLLRDPHAREWLGRNARKVIRQNQGAVERTVEIANRYLAGAR